MNDFDNNPYAASNVTDDDGYNETPVNVPDYLVASILVTLFCCLPLGIPAIIFAAKARSLKGVGQYQAALEQSNKAKIFTYVSLGLGLLVIFGNIALQIAARNAGVGH
ncbi:MAG: CD225/dispanin family protein [Planctomycetaceae bacterium]|nr:CD225/dispanin family protein [Planctomycetaceae bacterium]